MKRILTVFMTAVFFLQLTACVEREDPTKGAIMHEVNELYSDPHFPDLNIQMRVCDLYYIIYDGIEYVKAENKELSSINRFVFTQGPPKDVCRYRIRFCAGQAQRTYLLR